jgi:hypothetical protein
MTPEQWWSLYGNTIGAEDEWASGTLAIIDQTWTTELSEIVSPYTALVGGGWDVGAAAVVDLLTVDWSSGSAVGTLVCNLIGSVVGEAIGSLAGGIPLIGALGGIVYDLIAMGAKEEQAERDARARAQAEANQRCAESAKANYDVRGTGAGGAVLPCDWWIQADIGPDMRPRPTGRMPSLGQTFDAMLVSWPCWQVEDLILYSWNVMTSDPPSWPRSDFATIEDFYRATIGGVGANEIARWYDAHGAIDRWDSSWLRVDAAPRPYRTEWPQWHGLADPLRVLRNAIADQSAALRPMDYVDGGRALQPLWFDFWRQLTKVPVVPGPGTPNALPVPPMNFDLLRAVLRGGYFNGSSGWGPWANSFAFLADGAPPSPFVSCGSDAWSSLQAIETMIDRWTSQVFPAYGPDKTEYLAQLEQGWEALDEYIRGKLKGDLRSISAAAKRAGRLESADAIVSAGLRERLVGSGAMAADAADLAIDRDRVAQARRRYSFQQAVGVGLAGAAVAGALLWR